MLARKLLIGLGLFLGAVSAGQAGSRTPCPAPPDGFVPPVGTAFTLGEKSFLLEVDRAPETVDANLYVRTLGPDGAPISGGWIPHLDVEYRLFDGGDEVARGPLAFRLARHGSAYGARIGFGPAVAFSNDLRLQVTVRRSAAAADVGPSCPRLPLTLRFPLRPDELPEEQPVPTGGFAGTENTFRVSQVLQFEPASPNAAYSDVWGWSDGSTMYAVIGQFHGTYIVDVTDVENPATAAFIDGPNSTWRDIKSFGDYVYIVTEGSGPGAGLQIVDMTAAGGPQLVNTYSTNFATTHNVYIDEQNAIGWLVGTNNGTRVVSLADPVNPVEIASWSDRYVHDVTVFDDVAYLSEILSGVTEIVDVSNPASFEFLSSFATPTNFSHNSWVNPERTVLATTDETDPGGHVAIYDISDKENPVLKSEYQPDPSAIVHNVMWDDDDPHRVAMSHYGLGLRYIDVRHPGRPIDLGAYDSFPGSNQGYNGAWGVYTHDPRGYIYLSDRSHGLFVLEYEPTGGPVSGRVRSSAGGQVIEGAEVLVLPEGQVLATDADGVYATYGQAGSVTVRVSAPGYLTRMNPAGVLVPGGAIDLDVDLDPLPLHPLSGRVRSQADQTPIGGARLVLDGTLFATTSAPDGTFTFPAVPTGLQTVLVERFGFASALSRHSVGPGASELVVSLEPALFVDDFEGATGWSQGFSGAVSGLWERVDPNGTGGGAVQPEDDHTPDPGVVAFVTGQSAPGAGIHDNDVEGGAAAIHSPPIDLTGVPAARLRYYRFFSNNAGTVAAGSLEVSAGPSVSEQTRLEEVTVNANQWVPRQFDLGSHVPLTAQTRIRFLAQAGSFLPEMQTLEAAFDDLDVVRGCLSRFAPEVPNVDGDDLVDPCDPCSDDTANDADGDGSCGEIDNCPDDANPTQLDSDGDGSGDVCDLCPGIADPEGGDLDGDGVGDACDDDADGDGTLAAADDDDDDDSVPDVGDNCPHTANADQLDRDADGVGDACDVADGLVGGVRVSPRRIDWTAELSTDAYNVYRGSLGAAALLPHATCLASGVPTRYLVEYAEPGPGDGYFYLVASVSGGVESTLGSASDGSGRVVLQSCP